VVKWQEVMPHNNLVTTHHHWKKKGVERERERESQRESQREMSRFCYVWLPVGKVKKFINS
jgi:hypothetical protein